MKIDQLGPDKLGPDKLGPVPGRPARAVQKKASGPKSEDDKLKEAAQQFEAIFIKQMLSQMKSSTRALTSGEVSSDRRIYEDWQDDMLAGEMSKGGGIGLAEVLYRQLKPQEERKS